MPRGVEEKFVFPLADVAMKILTSCYVASTGCVLEPDMLGKGLNPKHIRKMTYHRFEPASLCKGNEECHHDAIGVQGELG